MTPEEILLLLRERARNIGSTEVGRRCGKTCGHVHKMVNGSPNITLKSLFELCEALGFRINIQEK